MLLIVGALVVIASVIGGFLIEGGHLLVLSQPAEFLIIGGAFKTQAWLGTLAVWGVALGTAYLFWLYYRVIMGEMNPGLVGLKLELKAHEVATLAPLALLALSLGLYPEYLLSYLRAPVAQLLGAGVTP